MHSGGRSGRTYLLAEHRLDVMLCLMIRKTRCLRILNGDGLGIIGIIPTERAGSERRTTHGLRDPCGSGGRQDRFRSLNWSGVSYSQQFSTRHSTKNRWVSDTRPRCDSYGVRV